MGMPVRPEVAAIAPYQPGRLISEVARTLGIEPKRLVKLASNECPHPPFPEVQEVIRQAISTVNRYPDNDGWELTQALASQWEVEPNQIWIGAGSSELIRVATLAVGGAGSKICYGRPSFVVYRLATAIAGSKPMEISLDSEHRYDLSAMTDSIDQETSLVFFCNPNNPTGTYRSGEELYQAIRQIPPEVVVVVDEAYAEYATASDFRSAIPWITEFPNLIVTRTFSKIYSLASLRVGYALGSAELLSDIRKAQAPFTVSSLGQRAALETLQHPEKLAERIVENQQNRELTEQTMAELGAEVIPSQANFIAFRVGDSTKRTVAELLQRGVIVRSMSRGWVRVTVGTEPENRQFLEALSAVIGHD